MTMKAEVIKWPSGVCSVHMQVRTGSLETGNHKTPELAKRAFIAMCNRLGVDKSKYEFVE